MKALTLWQPWASLVAEGVKPFEFRRYPAPRSIVGHRVGIHAGARPIKPREIDELIAAIRLEEGWGTALRDLPRALEILMKHQSGEAHLPLSAVLCTAVVGMPVPAAEAVAEVYGANFRGDSDRIDHQVFGWPMLDVRRLEPPVPARGAQGFWTWNDTSGAPPPTAQERAQAFAAAAALRAAIEDPATMGQRQGVFLDFARPRRGERWDSWPNLPGFHRVTRETGRVFTHTLLPGWEYTRDEVRTEMVADLDALAERGERPTAPTREPALSDEFRR